MNFNKNFSNKSNRFNYFIDNVAESKYGTLAWDQSVQIDILYIIIKLKNPLRHWSKLNGDGELVWGRKFFSTFQFMFLFYFI